MLSRTREVVFVDQHRRRIKTHVCMINGDRALPERTNLFCWHCRHAFDTSPIGLPLTMRTMPDGILVFETEGNFCSFSCCKTYLLDSRHRRPSLYRESDPLLEVLHRSLFGECSSKVEIPLAPSWQLLSEYGGTLSIEQFRASIGQTTYTATENTCRAFMHSIGPVFEENHSSFPAAAGNNSRK
jgi:hypothetical protein